VAVRLLLVEDNDVYRSSLELLLALQDDIEVVGAVGTGGAASAAAAELRPDVVVMDYRLPGLDGAEATRAVIATSGAAVVCLTAEATAEERAKIVTAGAVALIEKGGPIEALASVIRVAAGNATQYASRVELTRANTAIVLDSTSDFVDARERHANMRIVPLYVLFDGQPFRDHLDIGPDEFYERLADAKTLPTTSQPTPADFLAAYEELVSAGYDRIWSLHLSSKLSGTFESAQRASEQLGKDVVRLFDSGSASLAVALLAEAIDRRLEQGTTDEEIERLLDRFAENVRVVFTCATLEYLKRGGRIGKAQALAGSLLNVKPILELRDGVVEPIGRVRGRQKALEEFSRLFVEWTEDGDGLRVAIAHANAPEWIDVISDFVTKARPKATIDLVEPLGAVVGTHAGPGAVGFFWLQD
jgi:DegV family protein with EDD domain